MAAPSLAPVPGDAGQQRATPSAPISPSKLSHFIQLFAPSSQPTTAGGSPLKKLELSGSGARLRGGSLTHGSFESRRGSKSSSTESYGHRGHRTRSGTLPTSDSGGIGESPSSQTRSSWTASSAATPASNLFGRPSTESNRARSTSLSRTGSNTSSSTSSSTDYLTTPAQGYSQDPTIVKPGSHSPWSTSSREARRQSIPSPSMVDPRFQFPKKRASVPKPAVSAVGLGLGMTSAAPDRPAASAISKGEHRGSYVASLGLAPLVDDQGNPLPLYPASSPQLTSTALPRTPLDPDSTTPTTSPTLSSPRGGLLSAFQQTPRSPPSAEASRASPRRTSPKRKNKKHRVGNSSVGLLGQSTPARRRRRRDSRSSASGSSTDRPSAETSKPMRPSPSAPNLLERSINSPPRASTSHAAWPSQQQHSRTLPRPTIVRSSSFPHPGTPSTPHHHRLGSHAPVSTCEAYIFPRPRLTPASPEIESLEREFQRRQQTKGKGRATFADEAALEELLGEDDLSVRRVLRENEESRRERAAWSDFGAHSLGFGIGRKLSLSGTGLGSGRRRARSASRGRAAGEWETSSDAEREEIRRRKDVKVERRRVRRERERSAREAAAGSDTEREGGAAGDEGGYLNPFYSPPTVHSFEPFTSSAAVAPIKRVVRRLSDARSRSRERRRGSEAGMSSDGGGFSDGVRHRKPSWSRKGSAAPPLPALAASTSLADLHGGGAPAFGASGMRYIGNKPIRHLRTSPSVDSLSLRANASTTSGRSHIGEALSDLNGSTATRRPSIATRAATVARQNAFVSLPPHLHHILRSPNAPTVIGDDEDGSFIPSRSPPPVPHSLAAATDGSNASPKSAVYSRMSADSGAQLYIALEQKLAAEREQDQQQAADASQNKENVVAGSTDLGVQSTTSAPLAWRPRRSSSLDSIPHFASHPYSKSSEAYSTPASASIAPPSFFPAHPPVSRAEQQHSLPPPPRPARRPRPSLDHSPNLSLILSVSEPTTSSAPRTPVAEDLTTSLGPPSRPFIAQDTPTLGSRRAAHAEGTYFDLPVEEAAPAPCRSVQALATTSEDPFALAPTPPRSAGSGRSYEGHAYAAGVVRSQQLLPMDSPESQRSSGTESAGQTSELNLDLDEGEWSFDSLFFKPPPTAHDRVALPQPTPIDMRRFSSATNLTTSSLSSSFTLEPDNHPAAARYVLPPSSPAHTLGTVASSPGHSQLRQREQRVSMVGSLDGSEEASHYSVGEDPTFGRRPGRELGLKLEDSPPCIESDKGHGYGEADRSSTRQSEAWATAEDGGYETGEKEAEEERAGRSVSPDLSLSPLARPGPSPAQGEWSATSFARQYLGSSDSQPPSRSHSAPADQTSFIDFTLNRDSHATLTSPAPSNTSHRSSGDGSGQSFLTFDDDSPEQPQRHASPTRNVESRTSFIDDWSPPSSPRRQSEALSFPVILAPSSSNRAPSPPHLPHSPFSYASEDGHYSSTPSLTPHRDSYLSVDYSSPSGGQRSSSSLGIGGSANPSPVHSHFSQLGEFPQPPREEGAHHHHLDAGAAPRRPRSTPSSTLARTSLSPLSQTREREGRRRSSSFLDLRDEAAAGVGRRRKSEAPSEASDTTKISWRSFFSRDDEEGGGKRASGEDERERGFVMRFEGEGSGSGERGERGDVARWSF